MTTKKTTKEPNRCAIAVGNAVVIRTVTHCMVGRVVSIGQEPFSHCVLDEAAWVADTGTEWERFLNGEQHNDLSLEHEPSEVTVALDAIVDVRVWQHPFKKVE